MLSQSDMSLRLGAPLLGSDKAAAQPRKPAVPSWLRAEMLKRGLAAGASAGDRPACLLVRATCMPHSLRWAASGSAARPGSHMCGFLPL